MSPQAKVLGNKPSPSFRLRNPSLNSLRLRRIFDSFDHNGDGIISPAELSLALDRLGLSSDPTEISLLFPVNSAGLDFDAFSALHHSLGDALFGSVEEKDGLADTPADEQMTSDQGGGGALAVVDEMAEAFKVFDEDGDGFISAKELQTVLGKLGLKEGESLQRVEDMIGSVDCNHDGRVDFDEFKHMMMRSAVVVVGVN